MLALLALKCVPCIALWRLMLQARTCVWRRMPRSGSPSLAEKRWAGRVVDRIGYSQGTVGSMQSAVR